MVDNAENTWGTIRALRLVGRLTDSRCEDLGKGVRMKRRAFVLAVVFGTLALSLVAFQGTALAKKGPGGAPSISVTKTCTRSGSTVSFHVTVTNTGNGTVFIQSVNDATPLSGPGLPYKLKHDTSASWNGSKSTSASGSNSVSVTASRGKSGNGPSVTRSGSCSFAALGAPGVPGGLASTGFDPMPYAAAAVLLLGLGGTLVLATRRRTV